jgi:hypothetical protein
MRSIAHCGAAYAQAVLADAAGAVAVLAALQAHLSKSCGRAAEWLWCAE